MNEVSFLGRVPLTMSKLFDFGVYEFSQKMSSIDTLNTY